MLKGTVCGDVVVSGFDKIYSSCTVAGDAMVFEEMKRSLLGGIKN